MFSELVTREVIKEKHWKRLGRPDKLRTRTIQAPAVILVNKPHLLTLGIDTADPIIYMHPKLESILLEQS
jgi:hypothetical protein